MNKKNDNLIDISVTPLKAPMKVGIQITGKCNLKCKYCSAYHIEKKHLNIDRIKEIIAECAELGVFHIDVEGGEPTLHPALKEIIETIYKNKMTFTILTNGTKIDKGFSKWVSSINIPGELVCVSIDSLNESEHNAVRGKHKDTMRGIEYLLNDNVKIGIGAVLSPKNLHSIPALINYYSEKGVKKFHIMGINPVGACWMNNEDVYVSTDVYVESWEGIRRLRDSRKDLEIGILWDSEREYQDVIDGNTAFIDSPGCTAGSSFVVITPNLDVIPCDKCRNVIMGNLSNSSLNKIYNSSKAISIRKKTNFSCEVFSRLNEWFELNRN